MLFDNLECISIDKQTTDFPKHYHETFCISLIQDGIEQIDFDSHSLFSEKGSISITNPYEVHSNPLIANTNNLAFDTIYISIDLMKYVLQGQDIRFLNRKINNKNANTLFLLLKKAMNTTNTKATELLLFQFLTALQQYSCKNEKEFFEQDYHYFDKIDSFINDNIYDKFCLQELSQIANINKYGFVKKFKASTGMTPMNYILMKKIFSCKSLIDSNAELTEIAYLYNFTDMAHFSKTFKRFIGISPKKYQTNRITFS